MTALVASSRYVDLLNQTPPRVIRTEAENERYIAILEEMERRSDRLNDDERDFAELLTLLIEDFEEKHNQLPRSSPLDVVAELMAANHLKQKDLVDVFGTEHRFGGAKRKTGTEQRAHQEAQRAVSRVT